MLPHAWCSNVLNAMIFIYAWLGQIILISFRDDLFNQSVWRLVSMKLNNVKLITINFDIRYTNKVPSYNSYIYVVL